jgi:hypothetical protein
MKKFVWKSKDVATEKAERIGEILHAIGGNERTMAISCIMGLMQAGVASLDEEDRPVAWYAGLSSLATLGVLKSEMSAFLDSMDALSAVFGATGGPPEGFEMVVERRGEEEQPKKRVDRFNGYL